MDRRKLLATTSVAALLLLATLLRLPRVIDADATFNADEAVNALVVKHWFEGEPTLFNWDATYYGVVEGALALPAVWLLGFEAKAFRTVPVLAYLGFMLAVYVLGSRLYDRGTALLATGLLAAGSPMLILWSTLASGGYTLVILWGVLCLLQLEHLTRRTTSSQWLLLGALVGFGLYIYELFLVFLPPLLAGLLLLLIRQARVPLAERARWVLALATGGLAGAALKFAPLLGAGRGTKAPSFDLADFDVVRQNFRLLIHEAGPALFGINPFAEPSVSLWVGFASPFANRVGAALLIATLLIFCIVAVASVGQRWARLDAPAWLALILQPIVVVAAFVVSRNATNAYSARYLLPALAALTLVVAHLPALLAKARWSSGRGGGIVATCAIGGIGALGVVAFVGSVSWSISSGDIGTDLRPQHKQPPIRAVLAELEQRGIRGGYSDYWTSYEGTFLSREKIILTPFADWQRYPPYVSRVAALESKAWILSGDKPFAPGAFEAMLAAHERPFEVRRFGAYSVYTSLDGKPLFGTMGSSDLLKVPQARVEILAAPAEMIAGSVHRVRVRFLNTSDGNWSALGVKSGVLSVRASYRWMLSPHPETQSNRRTELKADVAVGGEIEIDLVVEAPPDAGAQQLRVTLVQESIAWFDQATGSMATVPIRIVLPSATQPGPAPR